MKISEKGIELIKNLEGLRKTAYQDTGNKWAIGYGHTAAINNKPISKGMTITEEQATELLQNDLAYIEAVINKSVNVSLSQSQYDALCSLVFNIGPGAFQRSELLSRLNQGQISEAANAFLSWCHAGNKKDLLLSRRKKERALFLSN